MLILINSLGGSTLVELIDGVPDLSLFSEPSSSILEAAFLAGNYTVQVLPETVVMEHPPDWEAFMKEMDTQGLFMIGLTANYAVFTQIFNMLLAMRDKQSLANDDCGEWRNFKFNYALGRSAFSSGQLTQVEAAMILANIPLIE